MNDVGKPTVEKQVITNVKWECKEGTTFGIGSLSWKENGVERIIAIQDVGLVLMVKRCLKGQLMSNGKIHD